MEIWVIEKQEGNYTDYRERELERIENAEATRIKNGAGDLATDADTKAKPRQAKLKFTYQEQREYSTIEQDIAAMEQEIERLDKEILTCATQYGKLQALTEEKEHMEQALFEKMERWMYLQELDEKIKNSK